jgi:glycosyltransferase involved in cell wall biosynthesis
MPDDLFFSVIIPTLNEEDYLPKILTDFTKQAQKNFEIIVVDASSQDKTKEKALEFSKSLPLEFYSVKKSSVSFQRNFGAQKAKGEYLVFLDADARVGGQFIQNLYKNILKKKGLIFLPAMISGDNLSRNKILFRVINSIIEISQSSTKPLSPGGAIFITKKLFTILNGFNEKLYMSEDHDLVQRARKLGIKAKILKDTKVAFSMRRVRKEGQIPFLYKNFMALLFMLTNGKLSNKYFAYEMGGGKYKSSDPKDEEKNLKRGIARMQKFFKKTSTFLSDSLS